MVVLMSQQGLKRDASFGPSGASDTMQGHAAIGRAVNGQLGRPIHHGVERFGAAFHLEDMAIRCDLREMNARRASEINVMQLHHAPEGKTLLGLSLGIDRGRSLFSIEGHLLGGGKSGLRRDPRGLRQY